MHATLMSWAARATHLPVCLQVLVMQQWTRAHVVLGALKLLVRAHATQIKVTDVGIRELSPHPAGQQRLQSSISRRTPARTSVITAAFNLSNNDRTPRNSCKEYLTCSSCNSLS